MQNRSEGYLNVEHSSVISDQGLTQAKGRGTLNGLAVHHRAHVGKEKKRKTVLYYKQLTMKIQDSDSKFKISYCHMSCNNKYHYR